MYILCRFCLTLMEILCVIVCIIQMKLKYEEICLGSHSQYMVATI